VKAMGAIKFISWMVCFVVWLVCISEFGVLGILLGWIPGFILCDATWWMLVGIRLWWDAR